jgi:hypothetical protein
MPMTTGSGVALRASPRPGPRARIAGWWSTSATLPSTSTAVPSDCEGVVRLGDPLPRCRLDGCARLRRRLSAEPMAAGRPEQGLVGGMTQNYFRRLTTCGRRRSPLLNWDFAVCSRWPLSAVTGRSADWLRTSGGPRSRAFLLTPSRDTASAPHPDQHAACGVGAGRALRVPPGWASGPPFPRRAAAGRQRVA